MMRSSLTADSLYSPMAETDLAFVHQLRDTVTDYLQAIDAWERKHGQTYRLPSRAHQLTPDLAEEERLYRQARKKLEALVPQARLLYRRYDLREPFGMLLKVNLGAIAPQSNFGSAIGGNERTEIARGLVDLLACCAPAEPTPSSTRARRNADATRPAARERSVWRRVYEFFF